MPIRHVASAALLLAWMAIVLGDTQVNAILADMAAASAPEARGFARIGITALALVGVPLLAVFLLRTLGAARPARPNDHEMAFEAWREATRKALAESRAMMERNLAEIAKDPKFSATDLTEFRATFEEIQKSSAERAKRDEAKYRANPAQIEVDLNKSLEEFRARRTQGKTAAVKT